MAFLVLQPINRQNSAILPKLEIFLKRRKRKRTLMRLCGSLERTQTSPGTDHRHPNYQAVAYNYQQDITFKNTDASRVNFTHTHTHAHRRRTRMRTHTHTHTHTHIRLVLSPTQHTIVTLIPSLFNEARLTSTSRLKAGGGRPPTPSSSPPTDHPLLHPH